jgi:hypothetical protein
VIRTRRCARQAIILGVLAAACAGPLTRSASAQSPNLTLAWDEDPTSEVSGFVLAIDGVRTDYGLDPLQADGACGCSVRLPFVSGRHTLVVSAYNAFGEASSAPLIAGPVANAGGPYSALAGATVIVSAVMSTDITGTVTSYEWDWGDGTNKTSSTSPTASHVYAVDGTFAITLTVADDLSASDSATTTATISFPPSASPSSPSPPDGTTGVSAAVTLTWAAAGATRYDVELGTTNPPPSIASGLAGAA